jgi:hypothetical protein
MKKDPKIKDGWDKAQIVSGFISTVVIAAVGILINSSIQNAQIASSEANTKAQVDVSERNNKAQLALTERTADIQRHLQEGTLTGQLVEHLAGGSPLKKQLAIVVLRRAIPPEMYQDVITILVKSDTDPEVRKTALEQARTLRDIAPGVAQAIANAATDSARSAEERQLATKVIRQAGLVSTAPDTTALLYAALESDISYERSDSGGGIFTYYLMKGLAGQASRSKDGNVRLRDLNSFVSKGVAEYTQNVQNPGYFSPPDIADRVIVGPNANFSKTIAIAIGNSEYKSTISPKLFGTVDAQAFAAFWKAQGTVRQTVTTNVALNATRTQILDALQSSLVEADSDTLLMFYYSGQALTERDGAKSWLLPVDVDLDRLDETAINTTQLKQLFSKSQSRTVILFFEATFRKLSEK